MEHYSTTEMRKSYHFKNKDGPWKHLRKIGLRQIFYNLTYTRNLETHRGDGTVAARGGGLGRGLEAPGTDSQV